MAALGHAREEIGLSVLVIAELLFGARRSARVAIRFLRRPYAELARAEGEALARLAAA